MHHRTLRNYIIILLLFVLPGFTSGIRAQDTNEVVIRDEELPHVEMQGDTIVVYGQQKQFGHVSRSRTEVRFVPDSVADRFRNDKDFSYANDPSLWKREPPEEESFLARFLDWLSRSRLMKWILYLVLGAIVIFTIYQVIVVNDFFVFSRKRKQATGETTEHEELNPAALDQLLQQAMTSGDFRLSTRLLYLKALQALSDKQVVQLNANATNQDYVQQTRQKKAPGDFGYITRIYEYAWYGEYPLSQQQFDRIHHQFTRYISQL